MTITGLGPWSSRRHSRIRSQWPTCLPGIRFCARGTLTYRASAHFKARSAAAVRATARLALDDLGRGITRDHLPEQLDSAQERLTLATAHWRTVDDALGLCLKARISLTLAEKDADRAQRYQDALRAVTRQLAQDKERRELLRRTVFDQPDAARIWWLERHLHDLSALDWGTFNEKILPLVGSVDDIQSTAERMARTLRYVWEKLGSDPGQYARFTTTARTVMEQMGWSDAPWPGLGDPADADSPESAGDYPKPSRSAETGGAR